MSKAQAKKISGNLGTLIRGPDVPLCVVKNCMLLDDIPSPREDVKDVIIIKNKICFAKIFVLKNIA